MRQAFKMTYFQSQQVPPLRGLIAKVCHFFFVNVKKIQSQQAPPPRGLIEFLVNALSPRQVQRDHPRFSREFEVI